MTPEEEQRDGRESAQRVLAVAESIASGMEASERSRFWGEIYQQVENIVVWGRIPQERR